MLPRLFVQNLRKAFDPLATLQLQRHLPALSVGCSFWGLGSRLLLLNLSLDSQIKSQQEEHSGLLCGGLPWLGVCMTFEPSACDKATYSFHDLCPYAPCCAHTPLHPICRGSCQAIYSTLDSLSCFSPLSIKPESVRQGAFGRTKGLALSFLSLQGLQKRVRSTIRYRTCTCCETGLRLRSSRRGSGRTTTATKLAAKLRAPAIRPRPIAS